jgi:hypothetical protein
MANEFKTLRCEAVTIDLVSTSTVVSNVTIPAGAIVTDISMVNNEDLGSTSNITVLVDTVAQTSATALASKAIGVVQRITPNATAAATIVSNNGGKVSITTSGATVGSATFFIQYVVL